MSPVEKTGSKSENIPLTRPYLSETIKDAVMAVLESGHWTEGPVTRRFEERFKAYIGCRHAIAVTSCTTGLEAVLRVLEIGAGDEVIVPGFTHPATACAVINTGATAVVVDVDPSTLNIDYDRVRSAITEKTTAAIPVSLFGNPLDWDRLDEIRSDSEIRIIEDAACSFGAEFRGKKTGNHADITLFSFHPRKTLTTGEGGMIATGNDSLAERIRSYKHFGAVRQSESHLPSFAQVGTNLKMSDILAAIGLEQLKAVDRLLEKREAISKVYTRKLAGVSGIELPRTPAFGRPAWQTFCILVKNRDAIIDRMRRKGIEVQIGTFALHREKAFQDSVHCRFEGDLDGCLQAFEKSLALPLSFDMTEADMNRVIDTLIDSLSEAST